MPQCQCSLFHALTLESELVLNKTNVESGYANTRHKLALQKRRLQNSVDLLSRPLPNEFVMHDVVLVYERTVESDQYYLPLNEPLVAGFHRRAVFQEPFPQLSCHKMGEHCRLVPDVSLMLDFLVISLHRHDNL